MAGTIDDGVTEFDFIRLSGRVAPLVERVENISRAAVAGFRGRLLGKVAQPFQMVGTRDFDDAAAVKTAFDDWKALKGQLVTLTDDYGDEYSNVMVLDVTPGRYQALESAVGGLSTTKAYLATVMFEMQRTA